MRIKRSILISILLIVAFVMIFLQLKELGKSELQVSQSEGSKEDSRNKYHVPPFETNWVTSWKNENYTLLTMKIRGVPAYRPVHLSKRINTVKGNVISEEDHFHFKIDEVVAYRLVTINEYLGNGEWRNLENRFINYDTLNSLTNVTSRIISAEFADSILRKWSSFSDKPLVPWIAQPDSSKAY